MIVDAATGRIERTMIRLENEDIVAALSTEYTLDDKLKLWVPSGIQRGLLRPGGRRAGNDPVRGEIHELPEI